MSKIKAWKHYGDLLHQTYDLCEVYAKEKREAKCTSD